MSEQMMEEVPDQVQEQVATEIPLKILTLEQGVSVELSASPSDLVNFVRIELNNYIETAAYSCYSFKLVSVGGETLPRANQLVMQDPLDLGYYVQQHMQLVQELRSKETEKSDAVSEKKTESGKQTDDLKMVIKMVADEYDTKKGRAHVKRTRELLAMPPLQSLKKPASAPIDTAVAVDKKKATSEKGATDGGKKKKKVEPLPNMDPPSKPLSLNAYYENLVLKTGNPNNKIVNKTRLSESIQNVYLSGWNPPPPNRRLLGDLFYLEAVTKEGVLHITCCNNGFFINRCNKLVFDPSPAMSPCFAHELFHCILGASASARQAWSALVDETKMLAEASGDSQLETLGAMDDIANVFSMNRPMNEIFEKAPWVFPQGVSANTAPSHTYDMARAQESLMANSSTVEEFANPRDWNDEMQQLRMLPATTLEEIVVKERHMYTTIKDFQECCRQTVLAIAAGQLVPANTIEDNSSPSVEIYFFNNIAFSHAAADTKDSFKLFEGAEANRKATMHDLYNQRTARALNIDGINFVLTTVIDYLGDRFLCQTLIPGVMQVLVPATRLIYGCLEQGNRVTTKNESLALMKSLCEAFNITPRNIKAYPLPPITVDGNAQPAPSDTTGQIKVDLQDECVGALTVEEEEKAKADPTTPEEEEKKKQKEAADRELVVPNVGPLEAKILRGADGRNYLIELFRLMPRDANYVKSSTPADSSAEKKEEKKEGGDEEKKEETAAAAAEAPVIVAKPGEGTGLLPSEYLDMVDEKLAAVYLLRPELLSAYATFNFQEAFLKERFRIIQEELKRKKEEAAEKKKLASEAAGEAAPAAAATAAATATATTEGDAVTKAKEGEAQAEDEGLFDKQWQEEVDKKLRKAIEEIQGKSLVNLSINPNVFLPPFQCDVDDAVVQKDEDTARTLSAFLIKTCIPRFVEKIRVGDEAPLDGKELTQTMHSHGINMRYLGLVAKSAAAQEAEDAAYSLQNMSRMQPFPVFFLELVESEIIARGVKHTLRALLRSGSQVEAGDKAGEGDVRRAPIFTLVSTLNHIFGTGSSSGGLDLTAFSASADSASGSAGSGNNNNNSSNKGKKSNKNDSNKNIASSLQPPMPPNKASDRNLCLDLFFKLVQERFGYYPTLINKQKDSPPLPPTNAPLFGARLSPMSILRRVCMMMGVTLRCKDYVFSSPHPFCVDDIISISPIVRSGEPKSPCPEARNLLAQSEQYLQDGNIEGAVECAAHANQWIMQVTSSTHVDQMQALDCYTNVCNTIENHQEAKANLIKSMRIATYLYGLDSHEVAMKHCQLAAVCCSMGDIPSALNHTMSAKYIIELIGGPHHPEIANMYMRCASYYSAMGDKASAVSCLQEFSNRVSSDIIKSMSGHATIAQTFAHLKDFEEAVNHQKICLEKTLQIYGESSAEVQIAMNELKEYKRLEIQVNVNKAKEKMISNTAGSNAAGAGKGGKPSKTPSAVAGGANNGQKKVEQKVTGDAEGGDNSSDDEDGAGGNNANGDKKKKKKKKKPAKKGSLSSSESVAAASN